MLVIFCAIVRLLGAEAPLVNGMISSMMTRHWDIFSITDRQNVPT